MNNVVTPGPNQAPEWFKTAKPPSKLATLDPAESLAEGIGQSYGVIGYKGKILSLRYRGENHLVLRPDDGTPSGYLDMVILRGAKVKAKSYYEKGAYDEAASAGKRPICASIDGVHPDPDVQDRQAAVCAVCPRNEWHTDTNGKKGRECADYKRLAVFLLPGTTARLLGQPLIEPVFLRIPPDSLNDLAVFGDNMAAQGWPYSAFITRLTFDSTVSHPKFVFKALQGLTDTEADLILTLRDSPLAKRITGEDEIAIRALNRPANGGALGAPTQSGATALGQQARAAAGLPNGTAPSPAVPAAVPAPATPQERTPAPPAAATVAASQPASTVEAMPNPSLGAFDGAFGMQAGTPLKVILPPTTVDLPAQGGGEFGVPAEPNPSPQPGAMIGQTAEDVGTSAADDPDLDARIAALIATS